MNRFLTSATRKYVCLALPAGTGVFVGFHQARGQAQPAAETIVGMYHVPDPPQWKKMVRTISALDIVRYDKTVPEGSLTLKFTRFVRIENTPAITRQEFIKQEQPEDKFLKSMLAATSTQVLSCSTQPRQFHGAPAYLTQFRVLRNQHLEEDRNFVFLNAGERYELDMFAIQKKPFVGTDRSFPIEKEAGQAWNTMLNGLTKSPSK